MAHRAQSTADTVLVDIQHCVGRLSVVGTLFSFANQCQHIHSIYATFEGCVKNSYCACSSSNLFVQNRKMRQFDSPFDKILNQIIQFHLNKTRFDELDWVHCLHSSQHTVSVSLQITKYLSDNGQDCIGFNRSNAPKWAHSIAMCDTSIEARNSYGKGHLCNQFDLFIVVFITTKNDSGSPVKSFIGTSLLTANGKHQNKNDENNDLRLWIHFYPIQR